MATLKRSISKRLQWWADDQHKWLTIRSYWLKGLWLDFMMIIKWERAATVSQISFCTFFIVLFFCRFYQLSLSPCCSWMWEAPCGCCVWQRTLGQTNGTSALCWDLMAVTWDRVYCNCSSGLAAEEAATQPGRCHTPSKMVRRGNVWKSWNSDLFW